MNNSSNTIEPEIIFEDESLLVLNKPAFYTVNRSDTTVGETTVQDWVENKFKVQSFDTERSRSTYGKNEKLKIDEGSDFYKRAGIVHRLDKETSGILLVAKTPEVFEHLQKQFKERVVKKTYLALVHGRMDGEGEIRVPVGRLPWNRKRFGVVAGGREAETKYKVLRYCEMRGWKSDSDSSHFTLLELNPETGRTHQIRVHLKYFGHPIFADSLYAGRKTARNDRKLLSRIFLHASKISFIHPKTGKQISFESLLPEQLNRVLSYCA